MKDKEFLQFIFERLKNVHGENETLDYMRKLKAIVESTDCNRSTPSQIGISYVET